MADDTPHGESPIPHTSDGEEQFLHALGSRVRALRARRGLTRRDLARATDISERYLANLEYGAANPSVKILLGIASALNCSLAEILGDGTTTSAEWLLLRDLLLGRDEDDLRRARVALAPLFGVAPVNTASRMRRYALVGLRGAGKSTLGRMLAQHFNMHFIEITKEIERAVGIAANEVASLYGTGAYHRYARRVVEEAISQYPDLVIATPGSIVSEPATYGYVLSNCYTVWLRASPEEHMRRVVDQGGDLRPIRGNANREEAMEDLKRILASRAALYGKADLQISTSGLGIQEAFSAVRKALEAVRGRPAAISVAPREQSSTITS